MERNCNDFIIRDGLFVRDFEGMYHAIEDPWGQNELAKTDLFNSHALFHPAQILPTILDIKEEANVLDAGVLCFVYNQSADSFSNKWLTYELLRQKLLNGKFLE